MTDLEFDVAIKRVEIFIDALDEVASKDGHKAIAISICSMTLLLVRAIHDLTKELKLSSPTVCNKPTS